MTTCRRSEALSFPILFKTYKSLLIQHDFEDSKQSENDTLSASDIQGATKKIFAIAVQQNQATLTKYEFYDQLSTHFISTPSPAAESKTDDTAPKSHRSSPRIASPPTVSCTPLLKEIGWDLVTELFLLYTKDARFSHFLYAICSEISPRELSIMFSEVFAHPVLSIAATHQFYQLHAISNHYVKDDSAALDAKTMPMGNPAVNMDASDDILAFHKQTNYILIQTLFVECIVLLFKRMTAAGASKTAMNHLYGSLIPTALLHFQTLSKELSYQFYLHNATQYQSHHGDGGGTPSTPSSLQYHSPNRSTKGRVRSMSSDSINALDATRKERQQWLVQSKREYQVYLHSIYALFELMVDHHTSSAVLATDTASNGTHSKVSSAPKTAKVDVGALTRCFQKPLPDTDSPSESVSMEKAIRGEALNTLWLTRYGLGVLSGVYWWYNVVFNEDLEHDGDVNNDSAEIQHNIKKPAYNVFMCDMVDSLKREVVVKLVHSVGIGGEVLFGVREYVARLERQLEAEKPWHLSSDQLNKSNPTTPTPQLQPMSSFGHPDLNTIVEEAEDGDNIDLMPDIQEMMNGVDEDGVGHGDGDEDGGADTAVHTASISPKEEASNPPDGSNSDQSAMINSLKVEVPANDHKEHGDGDDDGDGDGDGDDEEWNDASGWDDEDEVDPSKCNKMQETQALVDELKSWNEFMELFGVSCYYHSLWVLLQSDDCTKEGEKAVFKRHSKHIWKCIQSLFEQVTTLPAGIEFGEFVLNLTVGRMSNKDLVVQNRADLNRLLNTAQFHESGLWQLVQSLTTQLKSISDRALHQKLWQFVVHVINAADLKTRFQCIVSMALQCPIPVVQSLMFTELKNQIFSNWNVDLSDGQNGDPSNDVVDDDEEDGMMDLEDDLNPFCSRQVVMVLVQRLGKELQNVSLQNIYSGLDSLNASLNLCRFILTKDKKSNLTQIYDDDCPLKHVIGSLYTEMTRIANQEESKEDAEETESGDKDGGKGVGLKISTATSDIEDFQRQMMKNQFLVSLDLVKRIMEMYKLAV